MLETGLILKWYQNHLPRERKCDRSFISIGHEEANMDRTKGPFAVLIVGFIAAFVVLILEILVVKLRRTKRQHSYQAHSERVTSRLRKLSN